MASDNKFYSIDFSGKLVTVCEPMILKPGDFTTLQNVRYVPNGYGGTTLRGIGGITKASSVATTYTNFKSGFHFHKDTPSESHMLVQGLDSGGTASRILDSTVAVTGAETTHSLSVLYTNTNVATGSFNRLPDDSVGFCNGYDSIVYGGNEMRVGQFIILDYVGDTASYNATEFVDNNLTTEYATMTSYSTVCSAYVASIRPISGIKFYIGTANTASIAAPTVKYWNGTAWADCTTIVDGTSDLSTTGTITFDSTVTTAKSRMLYNNHAYWYLIQWTGLDAATTVYYVTLKAPPQAFVDIWDGIPKSASMVWKEKVTSATDKFINYTTECLERDTKASGGGPGTYMAIADVGSNDAVYIGSYFRLQAFEVIFGGKDKGDTDENKWGNEKVTALSVWYWNGSAWVEMKAATGLIDSTIGGKNNNVSFRGNGLVSWTPPASSVEYKRNIKNDHQLYYYKLTWDNGLGTTVRIDQIRVIPASKTLHPFKHCFAFQGRTVLLNEYSGRQNKILISHPFSVCLFNGDNSFEDEVLDADALVCGAPIHTRYSDNNFEDAILCSKNKTYLLTGNSSKTFKILKISDVYGCINANTMKTCHLTVETGKQEVVIWLSQTGVVMYDGTKITRIDDDIRDKFTPNHANVIAYSGSSATSGGLLNMYATFDERQNEYTLYYPNSTNADAWVYNVQYNKWWFMRQVPASSGLLNCGFPIYSTSGHQYMMAGSSTGYLYHMDYGNSSDGSALTRTNTLGDFPLPVGREHNPYWRETELKWISLYSKSDASTDKLTITHYGDSSTTGTDFTSFAQSHTGYTYNEERFASSNKVDKSHILHKFQFSASQDDTAIGFEPLLFTVAYREADSEMRTEEPT